MRKENLSEMSRGWFVGDFTPTLLQTQAAEVAVKEYKAGDSEGWHFHKIATEITVILSGTVEMNGTRYHAGDMLVIEPNEGTDFRAVTDAKNVVVKIPGAPNDKYTTREPGVVDARPREETEC
jgi:quercetin dioxygenase-like cupin family protein